MITAWINFHHIDMFPAIIYRSFKNIPGTSYSTIYFLLSKPCQPFYSSQSLFPKHAQIMSFYLLIIITWEQFRIDSVCGILSNCLHSLKPSLCLMLFCVSRFHSHTWSLKYCFEILFWLFWSFLLWQMRVSCTEKYFEWMEHRNIISDTYW